MGLVKKLRGAFAKAIPRPGGDVGGVAARGIVVEVVSGPWGDQEDSYSLWTKVVLKLRPTDAPDAPPTTVDCWLSGAAWREIEVGHDVPVRVDPATGVLLGLDADAHDAEVEARANEAKASGRGADPTAAFPDISSEGMAPIEGVSLELWATTYARITKDGIIYPEAQDAFAASRGVPPGRWAAIMSEWQARSSNDWRIGSKFATTYAAEIDRKP
ncbi:MAG: hypothetical protein QOI95_2259 [Acidimicrobiaceae bacterium]|jgi:hypothetical protein